MHPLPAAVDYRYRLLVSCVPTSDDKAASLQTLLSPLLAYTVSVSPTVTEGQDLGKRSTVARKLSRSYAAGSTHCFAPY